MYIYLQSSRFGSFSGMSTICQNIDGRKFESPKNLINSTLKKKRSFPEPFCEFWNLVKSGTLKMVPSESEFCENPTEP